MHLVESRLSGEQFALKTIYFQPGAIVESEDETLEETPMLTLDRYFIREIETQQQVHNPYVLSIQPGNWGMTGLITCAFTLALHLKFMRCACPKQPVKDGS